MSPLRYITFYGAFILLIAFIVCLIIAIKMSSIEENKKDKLGEKRKLKKSTLLAIISLACLALFALFLFLDHKLSVHEAVEYANSLLFKE